MADVCTLLSATQLIAGKPSSLFNISAVDLIPPSFIGDSLFKGCGSCEPMFDVRN